MGACSSGARAPTRAVAWPTMKAAGTCVAAGWEAWAGVTCRGAWGAAGVGALAGVVAEVVAEGVARAAGVAVVAGWGGAGEAAVAAGWEGAGEAAVAAPALAALGQAAACVGAAARASELCARTLPPGHRPLACASTQQRPRATRAHLGGGGLGDRAGGGALLRS